MVGRSDLEVPWLELKHPDGVEEVLNGVSSEEGG